MEGVSEEVLEPLIGLVDSVYPVPQNNEDDEGVSSLRKGFV